MKSLLLKLLGENSLERALVAIPAIACVIALPFAEGKVPMQWNLQGKVTWYAPASWGLPLLPITLIAIYLLFLWFERKDPKRYEETGGGLSSHGEAVRQIRFALVVVLAAVSLIQIAWTLGHPPESSRGILTAVALLIAFIGNLFGKLRPNRYVGIRVPWTLASETVWRRTHRAAGWIWTTSGIVVAVMCWFFPESIMSSRWAYLWIFVLVVPPLFVAWNASRPYSKN